MGTNSKHTEGKLSSEINNGKIELVTDDRLVCIMVRDQHKDGFTYSKEQKANAKRIVEIWNNWDAVIGELERLKNFLNNYGCYDSLGHNMMPDIDTDTTQDILDNISKANRH